MKTRNLFLLSASLLLACATIGSTSLKATKLVAEGDLVAELNTVNSWMKPGFNYDLTNDEPRAFKILVGVDYSLKNVAETASATNYGISVSANNDEVLFDFSGEEETWLQGQGLDAEGSKFYVVIELGDITSDCIRGTTEFTAKSYMTVDETTVYADDFATSVSVHSFEDLVKAAEYDEVEQIVQLREDASTWHNYVTDTVTNTFGYTIYKTECSECHETSYALKTSEEAEPVAVNGALTDFTGVEIIMENDNPFLAISGTYVGTISKDDYRIGDKNLKQCDMTHNTVGDTYLTAGAKSSSVIADGNFTLKYDLNSINYGSGLWRQFTFAPTMFAYGTELDIKCDVANDNYFVNADKNASYKAMNGEDNQVLVSWCNNQTDEGNPNGEFKRGLDFMMHTYSPVMGNYTNANGHQSPYLEIYGWVRTEEEALNIEANISRYTLASASTTSKTTHSFPSVSANHEAVSDGFKVGLRFDVHDFRFDTRSTLLGLKYDGLWYQKRESSSATYQGNDGLLKIKNLPEKIETEAGHNYVVYKLKNFYGWAELYASWDGRSESTSECDHSY